MLALLGNQFAEEIINDKCADEWDTLKQFFSFQKEIQVSQDRAKSVLVSEQQGE